MTIAERFQTTETLRAFLTPRVRVSDLAEQAGVSRQYVTSVVRGERPPSDRILAAAAALGIPVDTSSAAQAVGSDSSVPAPTSSRGGSR